MNANSVDEVVMERMEFTDGERTFTCQAQGSAASPATLWWWVSVTGESSRYAAFRAEAGDTVRTLQPRVVAYYEELLAVRARPPVTRAHWSQRRRAEIEAKAAVEVVGEVAGEPAVAIPA